MNKYEEMLGLYIDNQLPDEERVELEAELKISPALQQQYQTLKRIDHLFMDAPMMAPSLNFTARFEVRLEKRLHRRRNMIGTAIISAILVLATGLLAWSIASSGLDLSVLSNGDTLFRSLIGLTQSAFDGVTFVVKVATLLGETMLQLIQHPIFLGLVILGMGLVSLWAQLLRWFTTSRRSAIA